MITRINISIGGKSFNRFENFSVSQSFDSHHIMDISLQLDDVNDFFGVDSSTGSVGLGKLTQEWAGEKITVTVSQGETDLAGILSVDQEQVFDALITEIQLQIRDYVDGTVTITAMSPTIVLDSGENTYSFTDITLSDLMKKVLKVEGWQSAVSPSNNPTIPYVTQYRESAYNFIQRIAKKYGEWFLYDGSRFVFGKSQMSGKPAVLLEYGSNLVDMSYETKLVPLTGQATYYDYFKDEDISYQSTDSEVVVQNVGQTVLEKSLNTYTFKHIDLSYQNYHEKPPLVSEFTNRLRMSSNQMVVLRGKCTSLGLSPGSTISVNDDVQLNGRTLRTENYGNFLIVHTSHYLDANGRYQSSFEAIPNNPDFPPSQYPLVHQPRAENQLAHVTDTNDPEKLGRVQVRFAWQHPANATTPWIRVASLMSGINQGVYFVPEINEAVFVDFEFGNPDLPFVRGSMFRGSAKPGDRLFEQNNNFKGIITKGGNHILIDDSDGKENIRIYNKENKNEITLSLDGSTHIDIISQGKITIDADEIELRAKNISMKAKEQFDVTADQKLNLKSKDYASFDGENTLDLSSGQKVNIVGMSEINLDSTSGKMITEASEIQMKALSKLKLGAANISIEGSAQATLDGGAMTTVKGSMVMIN